MIRVTAILLLCFIISSFAKHDYDREIAKQKEELGELKEELEKEKQALNDLMQKKSGALDQLNRLQENIALTEKYLQKLASTEEALNQSLESTQKDLASIQGRISERNLIMGKRVRTLFISGRPQLSPLMLWHPGQSLASTWDKTFLMSKVLEYDKNLLQASQKDADLKAITLQKMQNRREELEAFKSHKAKEMDTYSTAKKNQEIQLSELQANVENKKEALQQLEDNARLITEIIRTLEKRRKEELAKHSKKASTLETGEKYCMPADGDIAAEYGLHFNPSLKITTKNLGIEIQSKRGSPVRAAVSGDVAMITHIPGYGPGIILDNGSNYFTIYANVNGITVNVGDKVKTCQEMGRAPGQGHVYFEVRQGTKTLDPLKWLKQ